MKIYAFYHISANKFLTLYYRIALHVYFFIVYLSQINYKIVTISFLYCLNT